ncbi:aminopeptidase P family protein [Aquamicrobium sp. LC103]|nr:aminopeptidase P family protein [Aquamicrobium sp. LC103]
MEHDGLDAIVLSDKKNVEYVTDLQTLSWAYKARPLFVLVTARELIVIGSLAERKNVETRPRGFVARYYNGYLVEAVAMVVDAVQVTVGTSTPTIALDYGQDMLGRGSLELIEALQSLSANRRLASAASTLWHVRLVKSPLEIERKGIALAIVNEAFDEAIAQARIGITEFELCRMLQARIYTNGAESADPIAMLFSKGDFIYCRPPGTRHLQTGHYVWTDFRATYGGYPADRNRTARAGAPLRWEEEVYTAIRDLTIALASSVRPGMICCDVHAEFQRLWSDAGLGKVYGAVSRIGHGGGLDVTEPPSISPSDRTVIRPGMILHLEPKLERDGAVFQFEEVVAVGADGVEFISDLSPERIPVIL